MPALKGHRCQPLCCSEWTRGMEVRGHRATSSTSHTHSSYSRWRSLSRRPLPNPPSLYYHSSMFCKNFSEVMHELGMIAALFSLRASLIRIHLSESRWGAIFLHLFIYFFNTFTHSLHTHSVECCRDTIGTFCCISVRWTLTPAPFLPVKKGLWVKITRKSGHMLPDLTGRSTWHEQKHSKLWLNGLVI